MKKGEELKNNYFGSSCHAYDPSCDSLNANEDPAYGSVADVLYICRKGEESMMEEWKERQKKRYANLRGGG